MQVLDFMAFSCGKETSVIELCCGDLAEMGLNEEVDILVVSAAPDYYMPVQTSLIGALARKGVSVQHMAASKVVDLRPYCCCWMSSDIQPPIPGIHFRRLFCFEPLVRGDPPKMVEDLFRGLAAFLNDSQPSYSIDMPLLASGNQAISIVAMLGSLLQSALRWIQFGLPIRRLRIVEKCTVKAALIKDEFALVKRALVLHAGSETKRERRPIRYLLSHAPEDRLLRDELVQSLQVLSRQKALEIWHEGLVLPGTKVDDEIERHIDHDDIILILVSPDFLASDRCMAQMERALRRHEQHEARLIPLLARPATWSAAPFGSLPLLPTDGTPVTSWPNRDQAWANISGGIRLLSMHR